MSKTLKYRVGSGFTSGRILPKAPGTEGSAVATVLGFTGWYLGGPAMITVLFLASLAAGFWSAPWYIQTHGKDPSSFVMDEWAGQLLALHILWIIPEYHNLTIFTLVSICAFVLFRFFDIFKPLGIEHVESLPGSLGVMADDIIAGLYTFLTLFFVILAIL
jgi:phosphatidylglycerophosphatase A